MSFSILDRVSLLRYQVYCAEKGYLFPESFTVPKEADPYAAHAVTVYAVDEEDTLVGTGRLIAPSQAPEFQRHCALDPDARVPALSVIAEVSQIILPMAVRGVSAVPRFEVRAVSHDGADLGVRVTPPPEVAIRGLQGATPVILLSLFKAMYQRNPQAAGHWLGCMEPALHRLLRRLGFVFNKVGPLNEDEGIAPYLANLAELSNALQVNNAALHAWFYAQ